MPKQLPINWDASTTARLKRAVSQLKRSALTNVPKSYKEAKSSIYSKADLVDVERMARAAARPVNKKKTKLGIEYIQNQETVQRAQTRIINRKRAREAERLGIDMNISNPKIPISERQKVFLPRKQTRVQDYTSQRGYEQHIENIAKQASGDYYENRYSLYKQNWLAAMEKSGYGDYDSAWLKYYVDLLSDFDFFRISFDNDILNIQFHYRDGERNMKVEMMIGELKAAIDELGINSKEFIPEDYW